MAQLNSTLCCVWKFHRQICQNLENKPNLVDKIHVNNDACFSVKINTAVQLCVM